MEYKTMAGENFPSLPEGYRFITTIGKFDLLITLQEFDQTKAWMSQGGWVDIEYFKDHPDGTVSTSTEDFSSLAEAVATVLAQRRLGVR